MQIAKVAELPAEVRAHILERVGGLPLRLYPFEDIDDAVEECLKQAKLIDEKWSDLGSSIAQFLYTVGASTQEPRVLLSNAAERIKEDHDPQTADVVVGFLAQLLESPALIIGSKATALYEDSERLLMDSKLLVDVRPIFDPRRSESIAATALLYKLRMTSRAPHSGEVETTIFTLRESELTELAAVVERALKKATVIREARPFGVMLVESKNDDDSSR